MHLCCPSDAASRLRRCGCGLVLSMLPGSPQLASLHQFDAQTS
jgi:hypothetical protein